jgi:hypothetical protein
LAALPQQHVKLDCMRAFSLMYHDVVAPGAQSTSGISGADADVYKLRQDEFRNHLDAIAKLGPARVRTSTESWTDNPVFLTFDDGGASSVWIASELERRGWRGHFFITTDWIGKPGFLSAQAIREMHAAGHVIGSHSASHPRRISALSPAEIAREWRHSVDVLANLTGAPVTVASVPGGFYSATVADGASAAGIRTLFTSEPTPKCWEIGKCRMLGRYFLQTGMPAATAASFAGGPAGPRVRQQLLWSVKKAMKAAGGDWYVRARVALFDRRSRMQGSDRRG